MTSASESAPAADGPERAASARSLAPCMTAAGSGAEHRTHSKVAPTSPAALVTWQGVVARSTAPPKGARHSPGIKSLPLPLQGACTEPRTGRGRRVAAGVQNLAGRQSNAQGAEGAAARQAAAASTGAPASGPNRDSSNPSTSDPPPNPRWGGEERGVPPGQSLHPNAGGPGGRDSGGLSSTLRPETSVPNPPGGRRNAKQAKPGGPVSSCLPQGRVPASRCPQGRRHRHATPTTITPRSP